MKTIVKNIGNLAKLAKNYAGALIAIAFIAALFSFKPEPKPTNTKIQSLIWFGPNSAGQTSCNQSGFNLTNGQELMSAPGGCVVVNTYCCAIGYDPDDCEEVDGQLRVISGHEGNFQTIVKRATP